jgi:type IV pilus assembly protein PilY1
MNIDTPCVYNPYTPTVTTYPTYSASGNYSYGDVVMSPVDSKYYQCTHSNRNGGCSASNNNDPSVDGKRWWDTYTPPTTAIAFYEMSPDVNRLYYDPRKRFPVRIKADGTPTTAATPVTVDFLVYFYKDSSGSTAPMIWTNRSGGPDVTTTSAYFNPGYAPSDINELAPGATTGLIYPNCVGNTTCSQTNHGGPFPKFKNRTDCNTGNPGGSCSLAEERQNYANWMKFHATRLDMVKTGLGYAFSYFTDSVRLGWSVFSDLGNTGSGPVTTLGSSGAGVALFNQTRKNAFYDWLYARDASSDTPTRESLIAVGKYYSRRDSKGPWADDIWLDTAVPGTTASNSLSTLTTSSAGDTAAQRLLHASCRRSYSLLTTDGYYNDNAPSLGDIDATSRSAITGTAADGTALSYSYNGTTPPYAQTSSFTTLADVAMNYWISDLRPDLVKKNVPKIGTDKYGNTLNNVYTPGNNESFWQNMSFFAVDLGVFGTLTSTTPPATWPMPPSGGNSAVTIDDMWHATINGRGRLLNASNSDDLSVGVEAMLKEMLGIESSQAGVAASSAALTTTSRKFTPYYTTGSWSGDIMATKLDPGSAADVCVAWRVTGAAPATGIVPPACSGFTTNGIPAFGSRYIYAWNGSSNGTFDSSNSYVNSNVIGANANLINFLRGDRSNEDITTNGVITTNKLFRTRASVLGDIVSSTPTFIGSALDLGYAKLPASQATGYAAFVAAKAARPEGILFVGANDGMLHGFRNSTGAEAFAFVPRDVMPRLHLLAGVGANHIYTHQYYVDGTTNEADACLGGGSPCTAWTNMLVGSLGAGGKEVYAIKLNGLTASATMGMSASNLAWEITTSTAGFGNLGNILSDIQTGMLTDGTWVAVFGNGYYGADHIGHLYVVNLDTGALIKDISTGVAGTGAVAGSNGLSGVTLSLDSNNRIVGAYAGDLMGNMWKFDLTPGTSSACCVGLGGSPLYAAGTGKPITTPPVITPQVSPQTGRVVSFGTGKLIDPADTTTTGTQSFYGIWDDVGFGSPMPSTTAYVVQVEANRSTKLVAQSTIGSAIAGTYVSTNSAGVTSTVNLTGYKSSSATIDWSTKRGWYRDMLAGSGERMVYPMATISGRLVLAYTISPISTAADPCIQSSKGSEWSYAFDVLTGAAPDKSLYVNCPDCSGPIYVGAPTGAPVVVSNSTDWYGITAPCDPNDPTCNKNPQPSPPPMHKFCGAQTGIPCPGGGVRRTWRQVYMR